MKSYLLLSLLSLFSIALMGQDELGCDATIYRTQGLFQDIEKTEITYGVNLDNIGNPKVLKMDVYDPTDNVAELRPFIVFAHGGAFVTGERSSLDGFCRAYSSMGYVTATIDYRLYNIFGGIPDSLDLLDVAIKSMHDMKAAVRFLKGSVDDGNPFRIDTNFVTVGGISAGGITAVQMGYLDTADVLPAYVADILEDNGGLEGSTFSDSIADYSSKIQAVINGSGAVYRDHWIDSTDNVVIYNYHGDQDEVVPFGEGIASPAGRPIITLQGSSIIRDRCEEENIDYILQDVPGGGHEDVYDINGIYGDSLASFVVRSSAFIADRVCERFLTSIDDYSTTAQTVSIYPNPAQDYVRLSNVELIPSIAYIEVTDAQGRKIPLDWHEDQLSIGHLPSGFYLLSVWDDDQNRYQAKLVKQ